MSTKETFSNRLSFIFSALGCAVGCGNIWRFPYLVGKYGGGIFLLMYLIIIFVIACPLLTMEFSLGRLTRKEPIAAYQEVSKTKAWGVTGLLGILVSFCWLAYLTPIFGILVGYLFKFMTGFFDGMSPSEIAASYETYRVQGNLIAVQSLSLLAIIAAALLKGVRNGLEKLNNICMPALIVILFLLCIRSLTLPGVWAGLDFYLRPDFSKFTAEALIAALGQALFSVGVGAGATFCNKLLKGRVSGKYLSCSLIGMSLFIVMLYIFSAAAPAGGELISALQFIRGPRAAGIVFAMFMIAACGGLYSVPMYAMMQRMTPESHMARVIASLNIIDSLGMVAAAMLTALMISAGVSISGIFLSMAFLNLLMLPLTIKLSRISYD